MTTTWVAALDDFEHRLVLAEAVLELGSDTDDEAPTGAWAAFRPPEMAEPFPADLVARAETLLSRAGAVERRLLDEQARIRAELARLPKSRAGRRRAGANVEFHA
jgi:hypothetical protein